jgi:hypothetical protein
LVEDVEIKTYVLYLQYDYTAAPAGFNARTLMESVENAYKRCVEAGTWKPMLAGMVNDEMAALKAMVEANNAEITALKTSTTNNTNNSQDKLAKRATCAAKYAWQKLPPPSGGTTTKKFEDRTYHWCPSQNAWTMHTLRQIAKG